MIRTLAVALITALLTVAPGMAAPPADGNVAALRLEAREGRTELTVEITGGRVSFNHFRLAGPPRVVVDIQGARSALSAQRFEGIHRGGVASVRTSQHAADVVRVVIDLESETEYTVQQVDGGLRVSLATGAREFAAWNSGARTETASPYGAAPASAPTRQVSNQPAPRPTQQRSQARRISLTFENTTMSDVLATFADLTGRSIVPGSEVGDIEVSTVSINNQPWDEALRALLQAYGLAAEELPSGIIRVDRIEKLAERERSEPLETVTFRVNYVPVEEVRASLEPQLSERGSISANQTTNTLIVADVPSIVRQIEQLVAQLDVRTPQVTIQAKIIFINRTATEELGVTYDLKDSRGNQLNQLTPGRNPTTGAEVPRGTDVVSLGGNSIAALGNANQRVSGPSLQTMMSLVLGRYSLITFLEALQSAELSDVQAQPVVTTSSNHEAEIRVGERTPIRVVDLGGSQAGGGGQGGGAQLNAPRATAELVETGIRLRVTPQVTSDRRVLLTLHAERSSARAAATEIGVQFDEQIGTTRVMVRDGETAVIGGLTVTEVSSTRAGIPFLMDVPYLGALFRRTRDQEIKRDLLIMVTPHLVEEDNSDR